MVTEFTVSELQWLTNPPAAGESLRCAIKMRSTMQAMPGEIEVMEGELVRVRYDEPEFAPAPGQSAVFYDGPLVMGGGVIKELKAPSK